MYHLIVNIKTRPAEQKANSKSEDNGDEGSEKDIYNALAMEDFEESEADFIPSPTGPGDSPQKAGRSPRRFDDEDEEAAETFTLGNPGALNVSLSLGDFPTREAKDKDKEKEREKMLRKPERVHRVSYVSFSSSSYSYHLLTIVNSFHVMMISPLLQQSDQPKRDTCYESHLQPSHRQNVILQVRG